MAFHSRFWQVNVILSYMDDQVALDIQDDGKGIDPKNLVYDPGRESGGFGISTMRERVNLLNGEVIIESHPGLGTTVAIQIPMEMAE
jgi:signal transduction histidine kinase